MDECLYVCASYCGLFGQCALSSVRLELIKRLDVVKHGVFNWDLSVPVLTLMGLPALTPMSSRFIWLFVYLFWGVLHVSLIFFSCLCIQVSFFTAVAIWSSCNMLIQSKYRQRCWWPSWPGHPPEAQPTTSCIVQTQPPSTKT